MKGSWALITGASSGFGRALAALLAARGVNLIVTARREDRLRKLKEQLHSKHASDGVQVETLVFDVRDLKQCEAALKSKADIVSKISILINNAGLARGLAPVAESNPDDWDEMIDTNIKGLLYMTRLVLPHMIARNDGHIVNLGSVAGVWVPPNHAVYSGTKFAVRAISDGLRLDLLGKKIRVTNIEPGIGETEFAQVRLRDEARAATVYKGIKPLSAHDVAESIVWCLDRPWHVNIHEMIIFPTMQANVGAAYTYREPT
jgi:3-hydroxy acid dehydrogenase / malonic semialdehyde reductase